MNGDSKNPGIVTIKLLCDGLGISLFDFLMRKTFNLWIRSSAEGYRTEIIFRSQRR